MSMWDRVAQFLALAPLQEPPPVPVKARAAASFTVGDHLFQIGGNGNRPWTPATIQEALGVPGIQRAVTLISNTMGSLSLRAFQNGAEIELPRVIQRPDPFSTPRDTYRDYGYLMATRGETVWWIASREADGTPSALVTVPLRELKVEENTKNRLFPIYRWGDKESTRYSTANRSGQFVHVTYLKEPGELRGAGPLQMGRAAVSVSVESQEWAASFFADGGLPSVLIKAAYELSGDPTLEDEDASETLISEAEKLREQWMSKPHNTPRVIDPNIESVEYPGINEQGAQMLMARDYQNGDAARLFGIPGVLLEYSTAGSSLTYQNIADVYSLFVKACLAPNYLEPVEQWLSDLLPRSTVVRFDVDGLLRADAKTRFEVYQLAVSTGIYDAEYAARLEGIAPGSVELRPIAPAPPAAVPSSIPQNGVTTFTRTAAAVEVRCDGMVMKRRGGIVGMSVCNKLLSTTGVFVGQCPRCKKDHGQAA